jgi:AcrR family transcriptional regulator
MLDSRLAVGQDAFNPTDRPVGREMDQEAPMAKARDTRTVILSAARALFASQGYAATSMRQVARQTGIAKATIYHHFKDKRSLMDQLVAEAMTSMRASLDALARETEPVRRLSLAAESALGFLSRHADVIQVARREVSGFRGRLSTDAGGHLRGYEELIRESIAAGARQGLFRAVDPGEAARIYMTMLQGSFAHAMLSGVKPASTKRAAAALLEVYLHGIAAARGRGAAT